MLPFAEVNFYGLDTDDPG